MRMNIVFIIGCSFFVGLLIGKFNPFCLPGIMLNIVAIVVNTTNLFRFSAKEYTRQVSHD